MGHEIVSINYGFINAIAKLIAYQKEVIDERNQDKLFYEGLRQAYIDTSDIDQYYAEQYFSTSAEADKLIWETEPEEDE